MMLRIAVIVSILFLASGCLHSFTKPNEINSKAYQTLPPIKPSLPISSREKESVVTKVTLGAIGDILIHDRVYADAEQRDGTYNFKKMFAEIQRMLQVPDILVANQETMIGGKELRLSTYPSFNSPHEVGDALKDAGVDLVTIANNHSLDRGVKVIQSALTYWDTLGIPYTGAFKSQIDHDRIRTITKNDITFSFLSYTYGTNGIPLPKGKSYLVNIINETQIHNDVEQAKPISDVVVVAVHWGNEYERFPNKAQIGLAQKLADLGVHIVIGNHPHVLQPPAWVRGKNGNETLVLYSLGNFLSGQSELYTKVGGMASIEVIKTKMLDKSTIKLSKPSFLPTYNYDLNWQQFKIISMDRLTNEQLNKARSHYEKTKSHMSTSLQDLNIITSN
ncbi:poly-gamma-glutamate capsule biosynthesis protein CapA/YwtB (metallophosphatase superfamily) [Paenibacillus sp. V4I3]|nr:poly-gamma-glutamate capsule biosynthesis protein CapA/YwtB (metallophosphatase superfamily) [Paenibacillus sp. V4I3]